MRAKRVGTSARPRPSGAGSTCCKPARAGRGFTVRKVTDQRGAATGGMWCCHSARAGPARTYAERGARSRVTVSPPRGFRSRKRHPSPSETPITVGPNCGASRCQPIPAPGG
jgi:hypothetical protein